MGMLSRLEGKTQYGVVANLGSLFRRLTEYRLPVRETVSVDMFASSYLPYEASRTYRAIMIEFDSRRSQTLMETQRQLLRGM
jgi:hypothetical protein